MKQHVLDYLERQNIDFQVINHPPLFTVDQAKEREDKIPGMHTKNIFIRDKKKNFYMISLDAHKKLDTKMFKLQSGITDFSFATPEQLYEQIQITPGSVGIFGLLNNPSIKLYIDQDIWSSPLAGWHPNDNSSTLVLEKQYLQAFLDGLKINYKIIIL